MADVRTMKLNLLADVAQFGKSLTTAEQKTQTFGQKVGKYSKAMAKSFALAGAAAGAYAIKLGVDGVKAAVDDELSQKKLAQALKNTTGATDKQIASTEDYIKKQQISFGIADTKLRPALANLARATGDLTKAQKLNNLAIDISAATGKDLETVSLALAKAYGGNLGALKKLGVPLDDNIVKTKDFEAATDQLQKLFGGSAKANTETFAKSVNSVTEAYRKYKYFYDKLPKPLREFMNPFSRLGDYLSLAGNASGRAAGGSVMGGQAYRVGEFGPEMFVPSGSGSIRQTSGGGGTTVINLNGIVDAASARRSIERLLQTQSRISGPINLAGAMP